MPVAADWGFFEKMATSQTQGAANSTHQAQQQKQRNTAGKRSNQDKQSSDLNSVSNSNKNEKTTPRNPNRYNGKGQSKADGKQFDQLLGNDDAILMAGPEPHHPQKQRDL